MAGKNGLLVIGCPYNDNIWTADCTGGAPVYSSELKLYEGRRAVDLYRETGLYNAMGLPVEVYEVDYNRYKEKYPQPCLGVTREFSDAVCAGVSRGSAVLVAGGFCNYAPAVAGGIQRAIGADKKIGIVWMDAHADCQIAETAKGPKRFVGLPMSTMLGLTMDSFREEICGLEKPCLGDHVVAGDLRIMDEETAGRLSAKGVHWLDATAFRSQEMWDAAIRELAGKVDAIFLSVDADVLSSGYVPAYIKAVPYGHDVATVQRNVRSVMATGKVAAFATFCFDFDRYSHGGPRTCESGAAVIRAGLESWL